ncbi:hypothetical protein HT031_005098 [Scenedesmus sp. PABB004]|nr:hypothetical protein HT031_005098 [Scenedesmus sp. PABB004]
MPSGSRPPPRASPALAVPPLLLLVTWSAAAAAAAPLGSPSDYDVQPVAAPLCGGAGDARLYMPRTPLTRPAPLVVMLPALGQGADAPSLAAYAHVFASNGLAVLVLSAPCAPGGGRGAAGLSGGCFARGVAAAVRGLAARGAVDAGRVAYWGTEWGGAVAAEAAAAAPEGQVQALVLQVRSLGSWARTRAPAGRARRGATLVPTTPARRRRCPPAAQAPWLGGTRAAAWRRLAGLGWARASRALGAALLDQVFAAPGLPAPAWLSVPVAGAPGSGALLELGPDELALQRAATGAGAGARGAACGAGALLGLLLRGSPGAGPLSALSMPLGYYATGGDADSPLPAYVAHSKTARFVGWLDVAGSRYALLGGGVEATPRFQEVVADQTMLLVALLGDTVAPAPPDGGAPAQLGGDAAGGAGAGGEGADGEGAGGEAGGDQLFPFQREGMAVRGLGGGAHSEL